jgi:uncharacterized repeat protein (TIGR01451 family)
MRKLISLMLASLLAATAAAAPAEPTASAGTIKLSIVGEMEQEFTNDQGQKAKRLVPLVKVIPGDEIVYTISYHNVGKQPADKVVITDPIPKEVSFKDGSAYGPGTAISYSVDGGKTFGAADALRVKGADGKERAAVGEDYTHVRYTVLASVAPGQKGFVRFRAILK